MRRFRELMVPGPPRIGWLIGILVHLPGESAPVRHFYAVGMAERARAEWQAADQAILLGDIASSPYRGMEPVETLKALTPIAFDWSGLKDGEVRPLGTKHPRRWLTS
jgi:hypothetical protein